MAMPNRTILRSPHNVNPQDVDLLHIYSPVERGQILSFTWWAYVNRRRWSKRRRLAAVTLLSPLMLFSSAFFEEMTDIPFKSASRWMVRPEGATVSRVTGSCDMRIVHLALEAATRGDAEFRLFAADMVRDKGVPEAMASRLTGVPKPALLDPARGIQFTPVGPDLETLSVRPREEHMTWWGAASGQDKALSPHVYGQEWIRDLFPETLLSENIFTSTPVPRNGEECYHLCIPELPGAHRARRLGAQYYRLLYGWEEKYLLPATTGTT
ncbi:hypothetical protein [Streptomyces cucumeris]|uniref:hypothetical protein n=1 Tax=Streptomyces cucumeris TaxID=2962890 RepID=UPI0020C890C4|nr:hypothetical protein [Streptomyces sp. NEAU-Y11]MCP9209706.1 hypothetical protein [Streptomyces sp. NEAU-Y11]